LSLGAAIGSGSPALPGMTVWLAGGTYAGCFAAKVSGTPDAPIVFRAAPGARAVLDGAGCTKATGPAVLTVSGSDTTWQDLEVTNSDPNRTTSDPGSSPANYFRPNGINAYGPRTKIIGGWVHDNGTGVGLWSQAVEVLLRANLKEVPGRVR